MTAQRNVRLLVAGNGSEHVLISKLVTVKHSHATTNRVEWLFSRAKIVMTDMHKSITTYTLRMNRRLWKNKTVCVC